MVERAVLIIEDDPNWQNIFGELVSDAGFKPVGVTTHQAALAALARHRFALAIVDISLSELKHGDQGGVKVLREIVKLPQKLPAIVVTGFATVDLAIETLVDLNAVHFFRKDKFNRRKFASVIKKEAISPKTAALDELLPENKPALLNTLSKREQQVLALLIQGQTNKQIGEDLNITVNTVKKHVQSIFTKFNVDNRAAAVARVLGRK